LKHVSLTFKKENERAKQEDRHHPDDDFNDKIAEMVKLFEVPFEEMCACNELLGITDIEKQKQMYDELNKKYIELQDHNQGAKELQA